MGPDTEIEIVEEAGGLLLRPIAPRPSMVKEDGLWVHPGRAETPEDLDQAVDHVREERLRSLLKSWR